MSKIIAIDAAPNLRNEDVLLSLKSLFAPWNWKNKKNNLELTDYFNKKFGAKKTIVTNSGRAALYMLISTAIAPGDEVITQAFTCLVVPNAISWAGGIPIFVDIEKDTYNIDPSDLKKKITKKTKVVIVQHTFGISANLSEIKKICKENNLILIEDCAHALGAEYKGKLLGTYGDGVIFSFNQDKVVSGVSGGVIIINNSEIVEKFDNLKFTLQSQNYLKIFKSLLHPLLWSVALPFYNIFNIGKGIIFISWKIGILGNTVTPLEQKGKMPHNILQSLSSPQSELALQGLKRLEKENKRRMEIAQRYKNELNFATIIHPKIEKDSKAIYLRYPIQVEESQELFKLARKKEIILGKWYDKPIFPWNDVAQKYYAYDTCPVAEEVGKMIINLPTIPRMNDCEVDRIIEIVKEKYGRN